ncbi:cadherin-23-like [Branchiostoma floridae]|uniref:Cadherin-23-like n=1 Tax=Branchiostoma floridae TaxID=7739 RepID=A0A9J7KXJ3_BRAFL|nr:cadherin-23-like [Branchiostoma floridae]
MLLKVILTLVLQLAQFLAVRGTASPQFTNFDDFDGLALAEDTYIGATVFTLQATDPDQDNVYFSIESEFLGVDQVTGRVILIKALDREKEDSFEVRVTATDNSPALNSVSYLATIRVSDVNDNDPKFLSTPYIVTLDEDYRVGFPVFLGIEVEDPDSGPGGAYQFSCGGGCDWFDIDPISGLILLSKPLDYEFLPAYWMLINCTDGGGRTSSTILLVHVKDTEDEPPVFEVGTYEVTLQENVPVGFSVVTTAAVDGDRGVDNPIGYSISGGNDGNFFLIRATTGEITVARPLDRDAYLDKFGIWQLTVTATEDKNGLPGQATSTIVTITIEDVNDEAPTFDHRSYTATFPENYPEGVPLPNLNIFVADLDEGANSKLQIYLDDDWGAFTVTPSELEGSADIQVYITNSTVLDYETMDNFTLRIVAVESDTNEQFSDSALVTILLEDQNDNAPIFNHAMYRGEVSEAAVPDTYVTAVLAMDYDTVLEYRTIQYSLHGAGSDRFAIDPISGIITLAGSLDYEDNPKYYLIAQAEDGPGLITTVPVEITVLDYNDVQPIFLIDEYQVYIEENSLDMPQWMFVHATDYDGSELNNRIESYTLSNTTNFASHFGIGQTSGLLSIIQAVDYEDVIFTNGKPEIHLEVTAKDSGTPALSAMANVTVFIMDMNDNTPVFEEDEYRVEIAEVVEAGATIVQVRATDADSGPNQALVYSLVGEHSQLFSIEPRTGLVTVAAGSQFDQDLVDEYRLLVIATDFGAPARSGTVNLVIRVLEGNNKAPTFFQPFISAAVLEDTMVGWQVAQLNASDADNTSDVQFLPIRPYFVRAWNGAILNNSVFTGTNQTFEDWFEVDSTTGVVTVGRELDRETAAMFELTVLAVDAEAETSGQTATALVAIFIEDRNDNPPVFMSPHTPDTPYYHLSMLEETSHGISVLTISAEDPDSPWTIINYQLVWHNEGYFAIDNVTGVVTVARPVDYEMGVRWVNFTVQATDDGNPPLSASTPVSIQIVDINDNSPVFQEDFYRVSIPEDARVGDVILNVSASDADSRLNGNIFYNVTGGGGMFSVHSTLGCIILEQTVDRENQSLYLFEVMATDKPSVGVPRSAVSVVEVTVLDVNDVPPTFPHAVYHADIQEHVLLYSHVITVQAHDPDEGPSGEINYSILAGNGAGLFEINGTTGEIRNAGLLIELSGEYVLTISATDRGPGALRGSCTVRVVVLDVNDHAPSFIVPEIGTTVTVPENQYVGYFILKVSAVDTDPSDGGRISYRITDNVGHINDSLMFTINEDNGDLTTARRLDREVQEYYNLLLVVEDRGSPTSFSSYRFITIRVTDVDDSEPYFPEIWHSATDVAVEFDIRENLAVGTEIGAVPPAVDDDLGANAVPYYYIIGGASNKFAISKTTGVLSTRSSDLDFEDQSDFTLTIKTSSDPEFYTVLTTRGKRSSHDDPSVLEVAIHLKDTNDNAPRFSKQKYSTVVSADTKYGTTVIQTEASDADSGNFSVTWFYLHSCNFVQQNSRTPCPDTFRLDRTGGSLVTNELFGAYRDQGYFKLLIQAVDSVRADFVDVAEVEVYILSENQQVLLTVDRAPADVRTGEEELVRSLQTATGLEVVVDDIQYHTPQKSRVDETKSDVTVHGVDTTTRLLTDADTLSRLISDDMDVMSTASISEVTPLEAETCASEADCSVLEGILIGLGAVLFVGTVSLICITFCLKHRCLRGDKPQGNGFLSTNLEVASKDPKETQVKTVDETLFTPAYRPRGVQNPAYDRRFDEEAPLTNNEHSPPQERLREDITSDGSLSPQGSVSAFVEPDEQLTVTVENGVSTIQPAAPVETTYSQVQPKSEYSMSMDKKHPVGILKKSTPRTDPHSRPPIPSPLRHPPARRTTEILTAPVDPELNPALSTQMPSLPGEPPTSVQQTDTNLPSGVSTAGVLTEHGPPVDTFSPPVDTCSSTGTQSRRRSDGDLLDMEEEPTPMSPHGPPPRVSSQRRGTDPDIPASGTGRGRAVTIPFQDSHIGPSPIKQQRPTVKRNENKAVPTAQSVSGKSVPVNEMAVRAAMLWNSVVDHLYCAGVPNPAPDADTPLPRPRNPSPHHLRRKSSESNPLYRLEKAILMEIPDSTLSSHTSPDRRQHRMVSPRRTAIEIVRDPHHYHQSWNRGRTKDRGQRSPYKRQLRDLQGQSSHNSSRSPHKREPLLRRQTTTEIVFERPDSHNGHHHKPRSHSTHRAQHKDKKKRDKTRRTQSHSPQRNVQVQTYQEDLQDDEETSHLIRHEGYPYDNDEGEDGTLLGAAHVNHHPVYPGRAQPHSHWETAGEEIPDEPTYSQYIDHTSHPEMAGKRGTPQVLPPDASPQRDEVYNPLVRPDLRNPKMSQYRGGRPVQLLSPGGSIPEESPEDVLGLDSPRGDESPQLEQNSSSGRGSLNNERPWIAFHDSSDSSPVRTVTGRLMSPSRRMHVAAQVHHVTETSSADSSPVRLASYSIPRVQNVSMKQVHQAAFQPSKAKEDTPRIEFIPTKNETPPNDSGLTVHVTPSQGSKTRTESETEGFQQNFDSVTPAKESLPKRSVAKQIMFFEQMSKSTGSSSSGADPETDVPISLI